MKERLCSWLLGSSHRGEVAAHSFPLLRYFVDTWASLSPSRPKGLAGRRQSGRPAGRLGRIVRRTYANLASYRLTLAFALTASVICGAAVGSLGLAVSDVAERNLIRVAEQSSTADAAHILSMIRGRQSMLEPAMAEMAGSKAMAGDVGETAGDMSTEQATPRGEIVAQIDDQSVMKEPDWDRLALWDRLRSKYLGLSTDPLDRSAPGFSHGYRRMPSSE